MFTRSVALLAVIDAVLLVGTGCDNEACFHPESRSRSLWFYADEPMVLVGLAEVEPETLAVEATIQRMDNWDTTTHSLVFWRFVDGSFGLPDPWVIDAPWAESCVDDYDARITFVIDEPSEWPAEAIERYVPVVDTVSADGWKGDPGPVVCLWEDWCPHVRLQSGGYEAW